MKELKEYIKDQIFTGITDIEIIKAYLIDNDLEEEGMEISHDLARAKIEKMKNHMEIINTWYDAMPTEYLYETYDLDIASNLHRMELDFLVNNGKLSNRWLKWAKENVPAIKEPKVYLQPCVIWLKAKDIYFAETNRK